MYATALQLRSYLSQVGSTVVNDSLLTDCLTRASDLVRQAMRAELRDPDFDYTAYGAASTKIVRGVISQYLTIPIHQAASVTLVEEMTGTNPATYTAIADAWLEEGQRLYRAGGWWRSRYRMTAVWGYGATIPASIEEITLELAVNIWRAKDSGGYSEIGVEGSGALQVIAGLNKRQRDTICDVALTYWQVAI
jgi:hypothetical protein